MKRDPVATRYARALMEIGKERDGGQRADQIHAELMALRKDVFEGPYRVFFESPKIPHDDKKKVLRKVLEGKISEEVMNLLQILVDRGRQMVFDQICEAFDDLFDIHKNRIHVQLESTVELTSALQAEIAEVLGKKLDREVIMSTRVNEDLLGGLRIRFGDTVVDGSVRTQLNRVREEIAAQRLGSELFHEN